MKKKCFTLMTLLLCAVMGVWADTYTNQASTVTFAFTDYQSLGSTNSPADAFLTTNFTYGSNLNLSNFSTKNCTAGWDEYNLVYFKPTNTVAKNASNSEENMLEWIVTPASGITFTPTAVSITACTAGGTGDPQVALYAVYSDDSQETLQNLTNPNRPDKTGTDTPSNWSFNLASAKAGKFILRAYLAGLTNNTKGVAFTNIVITGKVSGTPIATTTYTITVNSNDNNLGTASGGATVEENETVELTATPKVAGYFIKWQKDGADFTGNTENPITVTATADATYTAVFGAKMAVTFDKGDGTGTAPLTEYIMSGADYTIPAANFMYKSGATLTGWNDGTNTYAVGGTISNVTTDIALTAQFTDNTVSLGNAAVTVNWTFARNDGAPTINCENNELDYVRQVTIGGTAYDAVMHVNTKKSAGVTDKTGKLNNTSDATRAQVNAGTVFTVPVINGAVIKYTTTNGTPTTSDVTFGGETGEVDGKVVSYTYSGSTGTLDVIDVTGGFYPSGLSVEYPKVISGPADPITAATITETATITSSGTAASTVDPSSYAAVITTSGNTNSKNPLSGYTYGLKFESSSGLITIALPTGAHDASVTLLSSASATSLKLDGTSTNVTFTGDATDGYTTTINIADTYAGSSYTIAKGSGSPVIYKITLTYQMGTADAIVLTTTDNMDGWRTFYDASQGYTVDGNTTVYVASGNSSDKITLEAYAAGIPAGTPVLLHTTAADHKMTLTKATVAAFTGTNKFNVTDGTAVENVYRLGYKAGTGVAFFKYSATNPAAGIVYVENVTSEAAALTFDFGGTTTDVKDAKRETTVNNCYYNLNGQRVAQPTKGLYIVNGKKVIIK